MVRIFGGFLGVCYENLPNQTVVFQKPWQHIGNKEKQPDVNFNLTTSFWIPSTGFTIRSLAV